MKKQETNRNAFLALCELASKESWCWKIPCTTCGGMYFRMSFLELAKGRNPDDAEWAIKTNNHHNLKGSFPRHYSEEQQLALADIVAAAKVSDIAKQSKFPDWLGYLGLVLLFCEENERKNRTLTKSLIPQFLDLIPPHHSSRQFLEEVLAEGTLNWRNLELIEGAFPVGQYR